MKNPHTTKKNVKRFIKAKSKLDTPSKPVSQKEIFIAQKQHVQSFKKSLTQFFIKVRNYGVHLVHSTPNIFNLFKPIPLTKIRFIRRHRVLYRIVKKNESDLQLVMLPLILLMVLIILNVINTQIFQRIQREEFYASSVNTKLNPYPFVQEVAMPQVSANAAIIVDADSQVILFSKNPELRFSMASTTKIMTALTGLDHYKLDDVLTVKSVGIEGSGLGLVPGDQFTFQDLLYAMMLPSANDAAQAIADNYPGGADAFVSKMNEKADSLHLTKTHFADASGLNDDGDYTTVIDLARLASYAITNPTLAEISGTKFKTITNQSFTRQYPLTNLNRLLGTEGVTGLKTGTTEGAGEVLVTSTVKNGHTYIIVVMQSQNRFADTSTLMNFIDSNVQYVTPGLEEQGRVNEAM